MARKQATGWTHPSHWKIAAVGTVCQIFAALFIALAFFKVPCFSDRRGATVKLYKLSDKSIKCQPNYCYNSEGESETAEAVVPGQFRLNPLQIKDKPKTVWLDTVRILLEIGGMSNIVSVGLLLVFFWPVVLYGRVLNIILLICRIIDFFGAPAKFVGAFLFIWHAPDINQSFSWWSFENILQVDPLPMGLVLFSHILQTLNFVCSTLAMDVGAKGEESHHIIMKRHNLIDNLEAQETKRFERLSYHPKPKDSKTSSSHSSGSGDTQTVV